MLRKTRFLLVLALGLAAAAFVLRNDLLLPGRVREAEKTQVLVENLELEREVSGDVFKVRAQQARKMEDERIEAESIDVDATLADGSRWEMKALSGNLQPRGEIRLLDVSGRALRKDKNLEVTAKEAQWDPGARRWVFEGGVLLKHGSMAGGGQRGTADPNGRVSLMGEAWATWERP